MDDIERRDFIRGATIGAIAFTVNGATVLLTPQQARAQSVPLRVLTSEEAQTLEAIGETLAIGARQYGIAHFVDSQLAAPPEKCLLSIRVSEARPPYVNIYRTALSAVAKACEAQHKRKFADLTAAEQKDFVNALRQNKFENWQGRSQGGTYLMLRNDALDVAYGTVDGYARLNVPYMPHIVPERSW